MERPRDIKEGGASPGKVPRQAYGEGPGRKRSGPPSMNRYIRAGRSCDSGRARLSCFVYAAPLFHTRSPSVTVWCPGLCVCVNWRCVVLVFVCERPSRPHDAS